jgi:hypothetical protein
VKNGYIYTSADYGLTWTERTAAGNRYWQSMSSSSDGTKLAAVVWGGYIYTSINSGETWTERTASGNRSWYAVASSSDGTKLAACVGYMSKVGGYIYTSTNSGETWTERTASGNRYWTSIASSSDGMKLAATVRTDYIYISADYGATWTTQTAAGNRNWRAIASSGDGTKLTAGIWEGVIWTGKYPDDTSTTTTTTTTTTTNTSETTTSSSSTSTTTLPASHSGGGGGGGGCFIATAAFGSPMAGQVEILRNFRDRYLLTNAPGQKFVAWYYQNGPLAANWIKDKPWARAAVRAALYPLIGFSFLLIYGYLPPAAAGILSSVLIYLRFRPKKLIEA